MTARSPPVGADVRHVPPGWDAAASRPAGVGGRFWFRRGTYRTRARSYRHAVNGQTGGTKGAKRSC
ncbi:hypothetical protein Asera_54900 [Actinocatenispora sera]|uniref:Uncharacterized protein n=1 Tax=Actinocatenispora sera TaxID=390989 RepID=A0A810L9W2_9ACTN|nr:hypothetical protein Asera_54900 [Actinocatenispora sera]